MKKKVSIIDVTEKYKEKASPGKGSLSREKGFREKGHSDEIYMAQIVFDQFGGDIVLLAEDSFRDENPDYRWNGFLWDLKKPNKVKNLGKLIQKGLSQIFNNPGGIIIDCTNIKEPLEKVERVVEERIQTSMRNSIDVIFIKNGDVEKVLHYKK